MSAANPYAPPRANVEETGDAPSGAQAVRQEHIRHEAAVRSIGVLYYISAFAMVAGSIVFLIGAVAAMNDATEPGFLLVGATAAYGGLGALTFFVARGIRQLRSWARSVCTVLSIIGLIGFPLGTLINGYILYLLHCAKGKRVFAPDYAAIVAATPHVKYRTSVVVWIVLGILVLVLLAAGISVFVNR